MRRVEKQLKHNIDLNYRGNINVRVNIFKLGIGSGQRNLVPFHIFLSQV